MGDDVIGVGTESSCLRHPPLIKGVGGFTTCLSREGGPDASGRLGGRNDIIILQWRPELRESGPNKLRMLEVRAVMSLVWERNPPAFGIPLY